MSNASSRKQSDFRQSKKSGKISKGLVVREESKNGNRIQSRDAVFNKLQIFNKYHFQKEKIKEELKILRKKIVYEEALRDLH